MVGRFYGFSCIILNKRETSPMPEPKRPLKVFLCHARDDKLKTRELYRYLRKRGIQPWLDAEDLVGGQDWRVEIPKAIKASDAIIICLSKNSINKEGFVQAEITFALEKALEVPQGRIFIIPARFEDCEVPNNLERFHWVDLFEEDGFPKLMRSLKTRAGQLERATVQVPQPDESSPNLNSALKEKIERESVEHAEREQKDKELREKQAFEANEKAKRNTENKEVKSVSIKPKVGNQVAYWFGGFIILVLGIVLFSSLNNPSQLTEPTPEDTPSQVFFTATYTDTVEPSATPTPILTSISVNTLTPTPLPTEITDAKGVSMMLVSDGVATAFYMDKYEVTNALYKVCVDAEICILPEIANRYASENYVNHPVTYVDQNMAIAFCQWRDARLPTEVEWKTAVQGARQGCDYANLGQYISTWGWTHYCSKSTLPVGYLELGASNFNIYDLIGNVREWIKGTSTGKEGGVIGGSYKTQGLDVAYTNSLDAIYPDIGFRCTKDISP